MDTRKVSLLLVGIVAIGTRITFQISEFIFLIAIKSKERTQFSKRKHNFLKPAIELSIFYKLILN